MSNLRLYAALFALCAVAVTPAQIILGQKDTFQDGTLMSWSGGDSMQNIANGGPLGVGDRFLQLTSFGGVGGGSKLATHNSNQWSGNYQAAGVNKVEVDLRNMGNLALDIRIVLFTNFLSDQWTSTTAFHMATGGGWQHAVFSLAESDLTHAEGATSYANTITNVERLMIRHQTGAPFHEGTPIATDFGIDNVQAVPEPATVLAIAAGFGLVARRRRR